MAEMVALLLQNINKPLMSNDKITCPEIKKCCEHLTRTVAMGKLLPPHIAGPSDCLIIKILSRRIVYLMNCLNKYPDMTGIRLSYQTDSR